MKCLTCIMQFTFIILVHLQNNLMRLELLFQMSGLGRKHPERLTCLLVYSDLVELSSWSIWMHSVGYALCTISLSLLVLLGGLLQRPLFRVLPEAFKVHNQIQKVK